MVFFHALLGAFFWHDSADRRSTYKNDREREKKSLRISIEMPKNRKYKKEFQVSTMGTKCPESRSLLKKFRKQIDFVCKCLKMKYNINIVYFYFLLLPLLFELVHCSSQLERMNSVLTIYLLTTIHFLVFITTYNFDAFFSFLCILIKILLFCAGWCESPVPTHANATSFQGRWKKFLFVVIVKFVYRI